MALCLENLQQLLTVERLASVIPDGVCFPRSSDVFNAKLMTLWQRGVRVWPDQPPCLGRLVTVYCMLSKICYFTYWLLSTIIVDRSFQIAMVSLFWLSYACSLCESPCGAATPILHYNGKTLHTCSKRAKVHRFCSLIQSDPSQAMLHTLTSSWQTVRWIWNHVCTHICSVKFCVDSRLVHGVHDKQQLCSYC